MSRRADGCLIDLDGTVYRTRPGGEEAIPGVREALAALRRAGVPFRFTTNTTRKPRRAILATLAGLDIDAALEEVLTAPAAAAEWLRRRGVRRVAALLAPETREELAQLSGAEVLAPDVGDGSGAAAEALVVGDLGRAWNYENLNWGFRQLLAGARLVAVQRNRYWEAADGLALDAGAFVAALEVASGQQAELVGKPSRSFFLAGVASLGLEPARCVGVGDDVESDVAGARAAGLRSVLVRTGKFRPGDAAATVAADAVLDSLAELPAWLG